MRTLSLSYAPTPPAASPATPACASTPVTSSAQSAATPALSSDADLPASPATSTGASIPAKFSKTVYCTSVAEPDSSFNSDSHREEPLVGPVSSIALFPVSEAEVARIVQELKPKKSCDTNGMSVWLLKGCVKHLLTPLCRL
ncbi:hypothetical protein J6590_081342 [Homalodisca vitripennis]|nr:hypothetical protein J6590_081342 [Homalodisca vitripennis]